MIIKSLNIQAFGQFINKTFDFSQGLNVIYGLNESGKTTLHAFIEGILYGFFNPTIKVRKTLDTYDIFKPKNSALYGGSLTIDLEDKTLIIKRDLLQNTKDALTITNAKTGEDITNTLDVHPVTKQADIEKFIGIPYLLYQNTLSISTLPTDSDGNVGDMLMTRLQNIMTTKTESISTKKAIESLDTSLKTIGSESARTKPYAQTLKTLAALEDERQDALTNYNKLLEKKAELETLKDDHRDLDALIQEEDALLKRKQNAYRKTLYQEALNLKASLDKKQAELTSYASYKDFDPNTLETYVKLESKLDTIETQIKQTEKRIQTTNTAIEQLTIEIPSNLFDLGSMREHQKALYHAERTYDETTLDNLKAQKAILETKHKKLASRKDSLAFKTGNIITVLKTIVKLIGFFIILPLKYITHKKDKKVQDKLNQLNDQLLPLKEAKNTLEDIFTRYDVSTVDMFDELLTKTQNHYRKRELIKEKTLTLDELTRDIKQEKETLESIKNSLQTIKKTYDITSYEGLKSLNEKRMIYDNLKKDVSHLRARLEDKLQGETLDSLKSKIDETLDDADSSTIDETKETLKTLNQRLNEKRLIIERLDADITNQETKHRPLEVIDHDIAKTKEKLGKLNRQKDVINKAIEMIQTSAQAIEENFAPIISDHIKSYLSTFTLNRYQDIKVSKHLTFKVYDTRYQSLESKTHFSEGTKDQVYFAMRLGILDALNHKTMPLLLDDAFANFDIERLQRALETLNTMTKQRQILLFTCHKREETYLNHANIAANYHTLS